MKVTIQGLDELQRQFKKLEDATAGEILESAGKAGMKIIQDDAVHRAPGRRQIKENIHGETTLKQGRKVEMGIGVKKKGFMWIFFEKGTKPRYQKRWKGTPLATPRYVGRIKKKPFFRPAFDENLDRVKSAISEVIRAGVERVAK